MLGPKPTPCPVLAPLPSLDLPGPSRRRSIHTIPDPQMSLPCIDSPPRQAYMLSCPRRLSTSAPSNPLQIPDCLMTTDLDAGDHATTLQTLDEAGQGVGLLPLLEQPHFRSPSGNVCSDQTSSGMSMTSTDTSVYVTAPSTPDSSRSRSRSASPAPGDDGHAGQAPIRRRSTQTVTPNLELSTAAAAGFSPAPGLDNDMSPSPASTSILTPLDRLPLLPHPQAYCGAEADVDIRMDDALEVPPPPSLAMESDDIDMSSPSPSSSRPNSRSRSSLPSRLSGLPSLANQVATPAVTSSPVLHAPPLPGTRRMQSRHGRASRDAPRISDVWVNGSMTPTTSEVGSFMSLDPCAY